MSIRRIFKKLQLEENDFVSSEKINTLSKELYYNPIIVINYLITQGLVLKTLEGLFYVKNNIEIKENTIKYSFFELLAKALEAKKIDNWYFGLYTALKLNDIPNEINNNSLTYIVSNSVIERRPIKIMGQQIRFLLHTNNLLNFGTIGSEIKYSNIEKTILDLIYFLNYNQKNPINIIVEVSKYMKYSSLDKIIEYSEFYPDVIQKIVEKLIN